MNDVTTLRIAIGDYPHTLPLKRGEITSPSLKLDFVDVKPMHTAFKPMVRQHAYDASEMALVTYLQAKVYNKGLRLLQAAMLARFQHGTVLYNTERGKLGRPIWPAAASACAHIPRPPGSGSAALSRTITASISAACSG